MNRLNLTLDGDTVARLERYAKEHGVRRATLARQLLGEALQRRERLEKQRKLAADYTAGRKDASELLADLERPQLDLIDDEDA